MKVLVSAASKYGATAEIAGAIAEVLADHRLKTIVLAPEEVSTIASSYDALILGSAVYMGRWMDPATELLDRAGSAIASRPVWLFSSGPVGDPLKPAENPVDVSRACELTRARDHRVFAGKLEKRQLSFPERAMVLALRVQDGDFRDWGEIRSWATGIADALGP